MATNRCLKTVDRFRTLCAATLRSRAATCPNRGPSVMGARRIRFRLSRCGFVLAALLWTQSAATRTPSVVVVDVVAGDPVACAGVALRPSSVHIEPWLLSRLASPGNDRVHAAPALSAWEDASGLFLLRNPTGCRLFFGGQEGRIPARVGKLLGSAAPRRFAVVEDGTVQLSGGAALTRKGRRFAVVAPGRGLGAARGLRIHNYGRLEVYSDSFCRRGTEVPRRARGRRSRSRVPGTSPGFVSRCPVKESLSWTWIPLRPPASGFDWVSMTRISKPRGRLAHVPATTFS